MFMAVLMEEPKSSSVAKMSSNGPQNLAKYSAKEETHNLHWGLEAANRCSCETSQKVSVYICIAAILQFGTGEFVY